MQRQGIQIYIIDDEESIRTAYARLARSAKMNARTFASVDEFLQEEVSDGNACLVCDVAMPGKSGIELPSLLAAAGRHLPVIFVTGYDTAETRATAQRSGAAAYFRKPIDDQALLDAISWAVSHQPGHPNSQ